LGKVAEWKSQCSSTQLANSVQEAENLLKKHHELSDDISQIYAEVSLNLNISIIFLILCFTSEYSILGYFVFFFLNDFLK
jgi:hypothetical protein